MAFQPLEPAPESGPKRGSEPSVGSSSSPGAAVIPETPGYRTTSWGLIPDGTGRGTNPDYDAEYAALTRILCGDVDLATGRMILDMHKDMQGPDGPVKRVAWQDSPGTSWAMTHDTPTRA